MRPDAAIAVLPFFDEEGSWVSYDAACRAMPGCEHNQAWQGPGRGFPPDCPHNGPWRAEVAAAKQAWRAAQANAREPLTS